MTDATDPRQDPRFVAAIDMLGRTGAKQLQIRYDDDPEPVVWIADAQWKQGRECAAGLTPLVAVLRLLDEIVDGGLCTHCGKMTAVSDDFTATMPLADDICWYQFDPELAKFRRSCEGDTTGRQYATDADGYVVGRNDPCPCGSGQKFKRCHGA